MAIITAKKVNKHLPSAFSVEKRTIIISVMVIVVVVLLATEMTTTEAREMGFSGQHTAIRRLDCSVFCRKTGFSGYVGGCQCGFTLFANKRSQQGPQQLFRSRLLAYQAPSKVVGYPENTNNYLSSLSDDESEEAVEQGPTRTTGKADRQSGTLAASR